MKLRPTPPESNLVERSEILDSVGMARVLRRLAFEIVERSGQDAYFVGIRTGGAWLAERMVKLLVEGGEQRARPGRHRHHPLPRRRLPWSAQARDRADRARAEHRRPHGGAGRRRAQHRAHHARGAWTCSSTTAGPARIQLAVLVDRGRRELPIQPDFVGVRLQTTAEHSVRVMFSERGETDRVVLRERKPS